jgi:hypothetical protein
MSDPLSATAAAVLAEMLRFLHHVSKLASWEALRNSRINAEVLSGIQGDSEEHLDQSSALWPAIPFRPYKAEVGVRDPQRPPMNRASELARPSWGNAIL